MLSEDRYFDPNPSQKPLAMDLYHLIRNAPIISPHGHVDPAIFSQPDYRFPNPTALILQSDHYVLRMLYSQGISYDLLLNDQDPYQVWEVFAKNFYLFRGTPSGIWINHELEKVFGIREKLNQATAKRIYEQIECQLDSDEFKPRNLFKAFNIEVLATTDSAIDPLTHHKLIRESGWEGRVIPTFRPDDLLNVRRDQWQGKIQKLSQVASLSISNYATFIEAIEKRLLDFKELGAKSIDISIRLPRTVRLSNSETDRIFGLAMKGEANQKEADDFTAHTLFEIARMSCDHRMVMQIHSGIFRNHNPQVYERFGVDMGFDIPIAIDFTNNLHPMLSAFGNHPDFQLILFTIDESTYSRELAPLAGAYPSVKLGPPWWFMDSWYGMKRYFEHVMETAGIYNTSGFNDDTRSLISIPARHDVWRRASANWLAGLLIRGLIDEEDAEEMMQALVTDLVKSAYRL
jgi:glucuronate isomerase